MPVLGIGALPVLGIGALPVLGIGALPVLGIGALCLPPAAHVHKVAVTSCLGLAPNCHNIFQFVPLDFVPP